MAKCFYCDKSVHFGNNVSHSHRRSNRIMKSNIKRVKAKVDGSPKTIYVCTKCLRSGKVERAQFDILSELSGQSYKSMAGFFISIFISFG